MKVPTNLAVQLLGILVLAGLLVLGRTTIAAHPYEHDLAKTSYDCEFCDSFHVSKDDPLPASADAEFSSGSEDRSELCRAAVLDPQWPTARARAPPRPLAD